MRSFILRVYQCLSIIEHHQHEETNKKTYSPSSLTMLGCGSCVYKQTCTKIYQKFTYEEQAHLDQVAKCMLIPERQKVQGSLMK